MPFCEVILSFLQRDIMPSANVIFLWIMISKDNDIVDNITKSWAILSRADDDINR